MGKIAPSARLPRSTLIADIDLTRRARDVLKGRDTVADVLRRHPSAWAAQCEDAYSGDADVSTYDEIMQLYDPSSRTNFQDAILMEWLWKEIKKLKQREEKFFRIICSLKAEMNLIKRSDG